MANSGTLVLLASTTARMEVGLVRTCLAWRGCSGDTDCFNQTYEVAQGSREASNIPAIKHKKN